MVYPHGLRSKDSHEKDTSLDVDASAGIVGGLFRGHGQQEIGRSDRHHDLSSRAREITPLFSY
jgi:hypothetical protein